MIKENVMELLRNAEIAKHRALRNEITYDEAKMIVGRYVDYFNQVSKEKAKEFGQKAYTISVAGFLR